MIVPSQTAEGHVIADKLRKLRADELILETLEALKGTAGDQQDCFAVFTPTCVTWLLDHDNEYKAPLGHDVLRTDYTEVLKIQTITRLYETPAQVNNVNSCFIAHAICN